MTQKVTALLRDRHHHNHHHHHRDNTNIKSRRIRWCCLLFLYSVILIFTTTTNNKNSAGHHYSFALLGCSAFLVRSSRTTAVPRNGGRPVPISSTIFLQVPSLSARTGTYHHRTTVLTSQSSEDQVDDNDKSLLLQKWREEDTSGVYDALDELEREITMENADMKLRFAEHLDSVEYMERGKHPLFPTIVKHVAVPMTYALVLSRFWSNKLVRTFGTVLDLHFWVFVVASPMILLQFYRRRANQHEEIPREMVRLTPHFRMSFYKDFERFNWEDPDYSCKDHVLFLLEYWVSAVKAMVAVPLIKVFVCCFCGEKYLLPKAVGTLWYTIAQLLTRIAAVISLYQFPEMLYRLQRSFQPRPIALYPSLMRDLVSCMLQLAPLGFIWDFSKVLVHLPKQCIYPIYASTFVVLYGLWIRARDTEEQWDGEEFAEGVSARFLPHLQPLKKSKKLFHGTCVGVLWIKALWPFRQLMSRHLSHFLAESWFCTTPFYFLRNCATLFLLLFPLVGPLAHICGILKAITVFFCGGEPILTVKTKGADDEPMASEREWMYRVRWRDPERLWLTKDKLITRIQILSAGQPSIKSVLEDLKSEDIRSEVQEGRHLWDKVGQDLQSDPQAYSRSPPSTWKQRSMTIMAKKHQEQYAKYEAATKSGNQTNDIVSDPLGVALYRGFGVGLDLTDYGKVKSMETEGGGNRRLQVLAIEKAIQRYHTLHDKSIAEEKKEEPLNTEARIQSKKLREESDDKEIAYLAKRITDLVPSTADKTLDDGSPLYQFLGKRVVERSFNRVSSHEAILVEILTNSTTNTSSFDVDEFLEDPLRDIREQSKRASNVSNEFEEGGITLAPSLQTLLDPGEEDMQLKSGKQEH